ncbi:GNAT family N-acetyltransferase [Phocaeicola vulgatus]|uniref:GNAT family N-acetyltransferase n=1 Tax=Phocaeicola vulgatus TaxID=821 RepID=UPI003990D78C
MDKQATHPIPQGRIWIFCRHTERKRYVDRASRPDEKYHNGNEAVELGYILDNAYWHNGYGTEAARACLEYAFGELAQKTVCCSIRPENGASIRVAERLGMTLCGSHTVIYNEKEMPHLIYELKTGN